MGKKLCSWKPKHIKKDGDELAAVIVNATHLCAKCARSANRKSALCKPKPLES